MLLDFIVRRTRFVTFPRSGHHWLVAMLQSALGGHFRWAECYSDGMTLENCPWINAQKTHDFEGDTPVNPEFVHVIQFRNPQTAIESDFAWQGYPLEQWPEFRKQSMEYYQRWFGKWVSDSVPNSLIIPFAELLDDPRNIVQIVLQHITDLPIEEIQLRANLGVSHHPRLLSNQYDHVCWLNQNGAPKQIPNSRAC